MISYKPLLKLLIDKDTELSAMCKEVHISTATQAKFKKNEFVCIGVICRICAYLKCNICDVVEYVEEGDVKEKI